MLELEKGESVLKGPGELGQNTRGIHVSVAVVSKDTP